MALPLPASSRDFNPLDFYLWGYLKNYVYSVLIETQEQLKQKLKEAIARIQDNSKVFVRLRSKWTPRVTSCIECKGRNFEHVS